MMKGAYTRTNRLIGDSPKDKPGFSETPKPDIGSKFKQSVDYTGFVGERMTAEKEQRKLRLDDITKSNLLGGLS